MYLGLVLFTDILCHKAGTNLVPSPFLFLHPSSLYGLASFKIQELDCRGIAVKLLLFMTLTLGRGNCLASFPATLPLRKEAPVDIEYEAERVP